MKERWRRLFAKSGTRDAKMRWLFWLGLTGVLLIALSECTPGETGVETDTVMVTAGQVESALETRITQLLSSVEGVGDCRTMVTLESSAQAVYAADTRMSVSGDGESAESTFLRVETASGPVGLRLAEIQPTVKGVVVVCDGGGNETVSRRVMQVVTTAFHISERRVCVVKQK